MKDRKEQADAIVEKHYNVSDINVKDATKHAILSVNYAIQVLEQENEVNYPTLFHVIEEQTKLLNELESRL